MTRSLFTRRGLVLSLCGLAMATGLFAHSARAEGVRAVITEPAGSDRLSGLARQFQAWRSAGLLTTFKLLKAQPGQKDAGFGTLAIVDLPNERAFKAWSADASAKLGSGVVVRRASVVRQEGQPSKTPAAAVHVASFYAVHVSAADYKSYTERYVAPNMNLQRAAGIMSRYTMLIEQEPVGGQTRSLLVMEYADGAAYARRDPVKAEVKQRLSADADWKRLNDMKETIRSDISSTAASEVGAADH